LTPRVRRGLDWLDALGKGGRVEDDRRREDEWFRQNEKQLLETARAARQKREHERAAHEKTAELQRLKALHYMRCPKCGHELLEETLEGVKVDRCSFCEGIYFDAGELDHVLMKKEEDRKGFFRKLVKI
jgi:ribosomal protein L32